MEALTDTQTTAFLYVGENDSTNVCNSEANINPLGAFDKDSVDVGPKLEELTDRKAFFYIGENDSNEGDNFETSTNPSAVDKDLSDAASLVEGLIDAKAFFYIGGSDCSEDDAPEANDKYSANTSSSKLLSLGNKCSEQSRYCQDTVSKIDTSEWDSHSPSAVDQDLSEAGSVMEEASDVKAFFYIGENDFDEVDDSEAHTRSSFTASISCLSHVWEQIAGMVDGEEPSEELATEMFNIFKHLQSLSETEQSLVKYNKFLKEKVSRMTSALEEDGEKVTYLPKASYENEVQKMNAQFEEMKMQVGLKPLKLELAEEMKWKMEVEQEVARLNRLTCEMMLQQIKLDQEGDEGGARSCCCMRMIHGSNRKERYRAASRD
ncbi:uncharacterized protein LOC144824482 [Lissotriton helveticus]